MARIQVLITGTLPLLSHVLRAAAVKHADMWIVDESGSPEQLLRPEDVEFPDVLIVGLDGAAIPAFCSPMLYSNPRMKVLAVSASGHETALYELRPHKTTLGDVTPDELIQAVRAACGQPAGPDSAHPPG